MALEESRTHRSPLATISRRVVRLYKDYYGKGPDKAKTYFQDDVVVVLLRGGFTRVEETLLQGGHRESVMQQRRDFQQATRSLFAQVIEQELGRKVVAAMSSSHQHPDLLAQIFVLESETGDLLEGAQAGDDISAK